MADDGEDDEFDECTARFIKWLKNNSCIISPKIELADLRYRNAGRGVVATEDFEADEELFSIPRSSILTFETSRIRQLSQDKLTDHWMMLIMAMVHEYQLGSESPWKPYLDVLPQDFDTLMYWSDDELKMLEGSAVLEKIGKANADEAFMKHLPIIRANDAEFQNRELDDTQVLELCHRMGSTIMAYAFDLEKQSSETGIEEDGWEEDAEEDINLPKGMIPLADMLNADADRNNAKLFYGEDSVVMKTIRSVKKGEELFNDYGPLPRADVLRRYGYITNNYAKYDVVEISLDFIKAVVVEEVEQCRDALDERLEYLEEQGVLDDGYDICHASNESEQVPDELKMLLNTMTMQKADADKLKKKGKLPKPELEKSAARLLSNILIRRRALYPHQPNTEIGDAKFDKNQDDDSFLQRVQRRRAMAFRVIAGEKDVLQEAADAVERLLDELLSDQCGDGKPLEKKRKADDLEKNAVEFREANERKKRK